MEVFALTVENVQDFYPLLPEDILLPDAENGIVLLGASEEDGQDGERACGALVLQMADEDTWFLTWLLVAPEQRRRGVGSALVELACDIAGQMDMQVVSLFSRSLQEETNDLYPFFEKQGFSLRPREGRSYSILLGQIGLEDFFRRESKGENILTLHEVSGTLLAQFNETLAAQGQLLTAPISTDWAMGDVSAVYISEEKIAACVAFDRMREDTVRLAFAHSMGKGTMQMPLLLLRAYRLLSDRFAPETQLVIPCVTGASCALVEKLMPSAQVEMESYSARWLKEEARSKD